MSPVTEAKTAAVEEVGPQCEVATSCCAVMSWCSCSSPSVNAMITLAVPGGNIKACYTFNMIHNLAWSRFSNEWVIWLLPKFSWCICSFAFKWEDIFMVRLSVNTKAFIYSELWFAGFILIVKEHKKHHDKVLPSAIPGAWMCLHQESLFLERSAPFWCLFCREERKLS